MYKLSPWITEYYADGSPSGSMRILEGTNQNNINNRMAFVEKTPRVRIRNHSPFATHDDHLNWASGFKGDGPLDEKSKKWCDDMLRVMGYQFPLDEGPKANLSHGTMTKDEYAIIEIGPEDEISVCATYSGMYKKWPYIITDQSGDKFEFRYNDVLPEELVGLYSGCAKYKRIP